MTASQVYLFKRPNGFWYILYNADGRTKWKSTKCVNRGDALKKLTEFKELLKTKPKPSSNSFSSFTEEFLQYAEATYAKTSVDIFKVALRNFQSIVGDCQLASLNYRHVDLYKADRLRLVKPTTVNIELRSLRAILNVAVRWGMLEANPFSKMRQVRIPERMPLSFSKEDFQKFMQAVGDHCMRDVFLFGVITGMRRGEILNLKWSDIDFQEKLAYIQSSTTYRVKAGRRRTIPLGDTAMRLLERRFATRQSDLVFDYNGESFKGDHIAKRFKRFVRKAGLSEGLHFHSLRHTFATWLVQDRVSIYEIQKLLGHSDISVTQIYSHLVSSELHDAVNKISITLD